MRYKWLDGKLPGTAKKTVFRKLIIDQFGMTPILIFVFYSGMSILERKPDILEEFRTKFATTFATSCCFWIPMTTINFLLVPPTMRVVYVGCCTCIWSNILCYIKSLK
ncbi:mpv17-like protein [Ctenocephalides felis]|uniref:mpv17-like protein n=1 Tax=Ctenocephalides felis TaxID=7515 RepID=UPI000E6E16D9|nr:mpv17-like protein [Ctenocephalides felis]